MPLGGERRFRVIWDILKPEIRGSVYKYPEVLAEVTLLPMTGQAGLGGLAELSIALLHPFLLRVLKAIDPYGENC